MGKELKGSVVKRRIAKFNPEWEDLDLREFTSIAEDAAVLIADVVGSVDLSNIEDISDNVAVIFSKHKLSLDLSGISTLSLIAANALAQHDGNISFSISVFEDDVAEALSQGIATYSLPKIARLGSTLGQVSLARKLVADGMHRNLYSLDEDGRNLLIEIEADLEANKTSFAELPATDINLFKDISNQTPEETLRRCVAVLQEVGAVLKNEIINNANVLESNKGRAQIGERKIDDAVHWMTA